MAAIHNHILSALGSIVQRLPSIAYGEEKFNRWGPITATLNWCEEDYVVTEYCAELVNSITNLIFLFLSVKGMRNCLKEGHDPIFFISFMGLFVVGVGSFLFHSTLWYSMQLVDELSMIYTTCLMVWASFSHGRSFFYAIICGLILSSIAGGLSIYYHYLQDPTFHQNAFALLTVGILFRSFFMMEWYVRAYDPVSVNRMWKMVTWGVGIFLTGFALWNLDNAYCSSLRRWRRSVGMPWGMLSEGHGWWHLLTGVGAYYEMVYGIYLRHCLDRRQSKYQLVWPSMFSLPAVTRWGPGERDAFLAKHWGNGNGYTSGKKMV